MVFLCIHLIHREPNDISQAMLLLVAVIVTQLEYEIAVNCCKGQTPHQLAFEIYVGWKDTHAQGDFAQAFSIEAQICTQRDVTVIIFQTRRLCILTQNVIVERTIVDVKLY